MKEVPNTHQFESSKRKFLRSAAGVGLGSVAFAQGSLAREDTHDFVRTVKSSQQYQKISELLTRAGFQPQFDQATVFKVARKETPSGVGGTGMVVPTQNPGRPSASVELKAFQPANTNEIKLTAVVNKNGIYAGHVYTDSQVVKTEPGYTSSHDPSSQGPMPFGDWIPDDPIGTIIDGAKDVIDGATDKFQETWEVISNHDKIKEAYDLGEDAYDFGSDVLSPIENEEPPEWMKEKAREFNYHYHTTLDMNQTCAYITIGSWLGAGALTISTLGAGAITVLFAKGVTLACAVLTVVNAFTNDMEGVCNPRYLYVFMPDNHADSQGHPIPPLAVPYC